MNFSLRAKKQELEMEKKIYESPMTDVVKISKQFSLLDWVVSVGEGAGDVDAKGFPINEEDEINLSEEEDIDACRLFNIWE